MWLVLILTGISTCIAEPTVKLERASLINKIPTSGDIGSSVTSSVLECARVCSGTNGCVSLFYIHGSRECQRYSTIFTNDSTGLITKPSAVYFEKKGNSNHVTSTTGTSPSTTTTTATVTTTAATATTAAVTTTAATATTAAVTTAAATATTAAVTTTAATATTAAVTTTAATPTATLGPPCVPTTFACPPAGVFTQVILPGCVETFNFSVSSGGMIDFYYAKAVCESKGAKLMEIITVEKIDYMRQIMQWCPGYLHENAWIDGVFNVSTSTYETMGGVPIPMSGDFWPVGRPNGPGPDVCVRMHEVFNHLLNDRECTYPTTSVSICEL